MRPFHSGLVKSKIEAGRSPSSIRFVEYATTRERPEVPTHRPSGSAQRASTFSRADAGSGARSPASATAPSAPASCAKNTSAGELPPSSARVAASSAESP